MDNYISPQAVIEQSVSLGKNIRIYGKATIGPGCYIADNVLIGQPSHDDIAEAINQNWDRNQDIFPSAGETILGREVIVQPNSIISHGVRLGEGVRIGPFVWIGRDSAIGPRTQLMYSCQVYDNVRIGSDCQVAGFVCDFASIGNSVSMLGILLHTYEDGWSDEQDLTNRSPIVEDDVIVGYGATVIGPTIIRSGTFVAAGATVTKATPGLCVVKGVNEVTLIKDYQGEYLPKGAFFARWLDSDAIH